MFWISQSLIKSFFTRWGDVEHCPHRVYRTRILNDLEEDTLSMQKGRYFETLCLGKGAYGSQEDLPRLKNGNKSIDHQRIDEAVVLFNQLKRQKMLYLNEYNVQVVLKMKLNDEFGLKGNLDIFPTTFLEEGSSIMALIDLKLTMDITSTWGAFCWGEPQYLDTTQLICYQTLVRGIDNEYNDVQNYPEDLLELAESGLIRSFYWVFGYKKEGFLPLEVEYSAIRVAEFKENLKQTMSLVSMYEAQGWPKTPGKICHKCPVSDCEMQGKTLKI